MISFHFNEATSPDLLLISPEDFSATVGSIYNVLS